MQLRHCVGAFSSELLRSNSALGVLRARSDEAASNGDAISKDIQASPEHDLRFRWRSAGLHRNPATDEATSSPDPLGAGCGRSRGRAEGADPHDEVGRGPQARLLLRSCRPKEKLRVSAFGLQKRSEQVLPSNWHSLRLGRTRHFAGGRGQTGSSVHCEKSPPRGVGGPSREAPSHLRRNRVRLEHGYGWRGPRTKPAPK
mmetsp:Transcript_56481/g.123487  ORF Transcript_56481/g.123487 Transcript_56481/m.123487 type:complete len:200 (+) Transcript_56481:1041-1640(+)